MAATSDDITTATSKSGRPAKRARASNATERHGEDIEALFANPDKALERAIGPKARELAAPPEIVTNVQGSSAGAGSGEFHVYKASRRREYERLRAMDEVVEREKADKEWEEKRNDVKSQEDAKLSKNRARREKQKARQAKAKVNGMETDAQDQDHNGAPTIKKKLAPAKVPQADASAEHAVGTTNNTIEAEGLTFLEDD